MPPYWCVSFTTAHLGHGRARAKQEEEKVEEEARARAGGEKTFRLDDEDDEDDDEGDGTNSEPEEEDVHRKKNAKRYDYGSIELTGMLHDELHEVFGLRRLIMCGGGCAPWCAIR